MGFPRAKTLAQGTLDPESRKIVAFPLILASSMTDCLKHLWSSSPRTLPWMPHLGPLTASSSLPIALVSSRSSATLP